MHRVDSVDINRRRESFGELVAQLAEDFAALFHDEIALVRQEAREKIAAMRAAY